MADFPNGNLVESTPPVDSQLNRVEADFRLGPWSGRFKVQMTPAGLLAVGLLVSGILLSVAPIVTAATRHLRDRDPRSGPQR